MQVFQYGNYSGYYGYRLKPGEIDPRVVALHSDIFHRKRVLDIGCNTGVVTIQLACHYQPSEILGIDIDNGLVNKARKNVKYWIKRFECGEEVTNSIKFQGLNYLDESDIDNQKFDVITW